MTTPLRGVCFSPFVIMLTVVASSSRHGSLLSRSLAVFARLVVRIHLFDMLTVVCLYRCARTSSVIGALWENIVR